MKCLIQIDARQVGSICIDSNTYLSIYDVFKMNNLIQDIRNEGVSKINYFIHSFYI